MNQETLKALMHYDPESGVFTWAANNSNCVKSGDIAGTSAKRGYRRIMTGGKLYSAHRLAFLYMTGEFPPNEVDHINGITHDNRWKNLRSATRAENNKNRKRGNDNTSGVMGVYWNKSSENWRARVCGEQGRRHLGCFDNIIDAVAARLRAEREEGYHKNHGRNV